MGDVVPDRPTDAKGRAKKVKVESPVKKYAAGKAFMWFRVMVLTPLGLGRRKWEPCESTTENREADSRVHRYSRMVGFANVTQEDIDKDKEATAALKALREGKKGTDAHQDRVRRQAFFERSVLEYHPETSYAKFLTRIEARVGSDTAREAAFERLEENMFDEKLDFEVRAQT